MNTVKSHAGQLRGMSDSRIAWTAASIMENMAKLLEQAKCPNNCEDGMYCIEVPGYDGEGDIEVVECQWCFEKDAYIKETNT